MKGRWNIMRRNKAEKKAISIAAVIVLLGFVTCCALIAGIASGSSPALSGRFVLASLDDNEDKRLQIDNVLAAHAVEKFPTTGLEGFDDEDSFMRAHEGTQIHIAKNLDETTKFDPFPAEKEKIENQNEQNGYQLSAFLAKEDAQEKKDMSDTLSSWEDHSQSLQDELDYQDKLNDVLNENADRTGEQLKRQAKITSEAAEAAADEDERTTAVQIKKFEAGLSQRQASLAEDIVGLPDPSEPSDDERALLKQNIMSAERLKEFDDN